MIKTGKVRDSWDCPIDMRQFAFCVPTALALAAREDADARLLTERMMRSMITGPIEDLQPR